MTTTNYDVIVSPVITEKATKLSGIGTTIQNKILEYSETGDLTAVAKLREKLFFTRTAP